MYCTIMNEFSESVLNAKIFVSEFFQKCRHFTPPLRELDSKMNLLRLKYSKAIVDFLSKIKQSIIRGNCDEKSFKEKILEVSKNKIFHLEIWWYLMKCEITSQNDFLFIFDNSQYWHITEHLCSSLFKNIFLEQEPNFCFRKTINSDFLEILLIHEDNCNNKGIQSVAYSHFITCIAAHGASEDDAGLIVNTDTFVDAVEVSSLRNSKMKLFMVDLLKVLLQGKFVPIHNLYYKNEHFLKYEKSVCCKTSKILNYVDLNHVITLLKQLICNNSNSPHWENLFLLLNCMTSNYEQTNLFKQLKTLIQSLLEESLQNLNESMLVYAFILARHCTVSSTSHFPSYLQWFSSTFSSDSARPINTKEKSVFFINFLTETINYDSPYYMKVHINRVPCLPIECQSLLSDYVKLVKTRLIDLNESAELGIFDNMTNKISAEFDVETVLGIFGSTNEVPKCVLEASLFCRSYYEKKFLVTLLSKFEGIDSVRHKLITKLHNLGKVPNSMLLHYKKMI